MVPVLQQLYYSLTPSNWPFNSTTPFAVSVFIGDPNPGAVTLTWDFGDGTNISRARAGKTDLISLLSIHSHPSRLATQYDQPDIETHRYTSIGTYLLNIMATGSMNTVTKTVVISVQYPVSSFNVNFSSVLGTSRQIPYNGGKNERETFVGFELNRSPL